MMRVGRQCGPILALGLSAAACTVTRDAGRFGPTAGGGSGTASSTTEATAADAMDEATDAATGMRLDAGVRDVATMECASVQQQTTIEERPSDIVVAVDQAIQGDSTVAPIMENFSARIGDAMIDDIRVAMIAGYPSDGGGVCIEEATLGGGMCPDSDDNPPAYRHIDETIAAPTLLDQVLSTYDAWSPSMRPEAWKHLWVVSSADAQMPTQAFFDALLALDPAFERLTVHAVVPLSLAPTCSTLVPGTQADAGQAYADWAMATGGVVQSICNVDVDVIFDELLERIETVSLSCIHPIPEPPAGFVFEPGKVNVDHDDGSGMVTIGNVPSVTECAGVSDGWYYDDPVQPTEIVMCPATCERFGTLQDASVKIRFGCVTIPAQ